MKKNNNPTGKGGFKDNPQNINKNGTPPRSEQFRTIMESNLSKEELVAILCEMAKVDKSVAMYLTDRFFGKTKESIEVETPEGIEITIKGERGKKK